MRASENLSISPSVTFHRQPTKAGLEGGGDKEGRKRCVWGRIKVLWQKDQQKISVAQQ